jgi:hypothetical protein
MYPVFAKALLLSFLLFQTEESSPFKAEGLAGGGRACNGILRIYPNYLNWETGFSTCDHVPYKTLQSSEDGPWVYQFSRKKGCLYSILEVRQPNDGGFWNVVGYETVTAWRKQDKIHVIACAMY